MTMLAVLRHGRTRWNDDGRMQGRRDVPLSDEGRAEVRSWCMPDGLGDARSWCSSPLRRATETAELASAVPPRIEPALVEMHWGEWEGLTLAELQSRNGSAFAENERRGLDFRPPGGESPRDVLERVSAWLREIALREEAVIAVTHRGVLRVMLSAATGWDMTGEPPLALRPACVHRFVVGSGGSLAIDRCNIPLAATPDARSA